MRNASYLIMLAGILLMASAGYDEYRGTTHAPTLRSRYSVVGSGHSHELIRKQSRPEDFHNAMTYHWFYALMISFAGFLAFMIDRGQERVDPMSPDSDPKIDEELRADEQAEKDANAKLPKP